MLNYDIVKINQLLSSKAFSKNNKYPNKQAFTTSNKYVNVSAVYKLMKFIWLRLSDDTTIQITSIKIDDSTNHVNMNFSFLSKICSLFFSNKNAIIKLIG